MVDFQLQCLTTGWKGKEDRPPHYPWWWTPWSRVDFLNSINPHLWAKLKMRSITVTKSPIFIHIPVSMNIWMMVRKGRHPLAYPLLIFDVGIGNPWTWTTWRFMVGKIWQNQPENSFRSTWIVIFLIVGSFTILGIYWSVMSHILWVTISLDRTKALFLVLSFVLGSFTCGLHLDSTWLRAPGYEPYQGNLWGRPLPCPLPMFSKESGIPGWPENN